MRRDILSGRKIIFLFGFLHAALNAIYLSRTGFGTGYETVAIARSLAATGRFADPYAALATGLTAHAAPLYPAFLALVFRLFHSADAVTFAVTFANAVAFGTLLALLPALSLRIWGTPSSGTVAAWAFICAPVFRVDAQFESIFLAAALASCCLSFMAPGRAWAPGLLAGVAILLNPAAIPLLCVWGAGMLWMGFISPRSTFIVAAVALMLCAPWSLRNHAKIGTLSLRDNFPLELQVYNNDLARPSFTGSLASREMFHPNENLQQAELVRSLGERDYEKRKWTQAADWIRSHPKRFLVLCAQRYFLFWLPGWDERPFAPAVWIVTALSLPAFVYAVRSRSGIAVLLAGAAIAYSLVYALVGAEFRYCEPILWISILFAAHTALQIFRIR
jgi:hypothetical protein